MHYIKTIETYCVSCKIYTAHENSNVCKTKQNRLMILSKCSVCGIKELTFMKNKRFSNEKNK